MRHEDLLFSSAYDPRGLHVVCRSLQVGPLLNFMDTIYNEFMEEGKAILDQIRIARDNSNYEQVDELAEKLSILILEAHDYGIELETELEYDQ